jgi:cell division protein FtsW
MTPRRLREAASQAAIIVRRHKPDYQIALNMALLMLFGLILMYAIGPQRANVLNNLYGTEFYNNMYFFLKQTLSLGLALAAFAFMAMFPYEKLLKHAGKILIAGFIACALLAILGALKFEIAEQTLGASRWFRLGQFGSLQPSEFLKFGLLIFLAAFLGVRAKQGLINNFNKTLIPVGIVTATAMIFVIGLQEDMGTGIAIVAIITTMLIVSGLKWRIIGLLGLMLLGAGILFILIAPHRMERVATFLRGDSGSNSKVSQDDKSYHINHAKIALGSGGIFGVGIGNSVQATGYLPEAVNDSVFAIMGETFGFVGLVAVLLLFTALLLRLLKVADHLLDMRLKLVVAGVFGWVGSHVILNVAAMTGIFPLTGITLPLLSFGGTSMMFVGGALGLAFQLSRYTAFGSKLKDKDESTVSGRGLGRTRYTSRRRYS